MHVFSKKGSGKSAGSCPVAPAESHVTFLGDACHPMSMFKGQGDFTRNPVTKTLEGQGWVQGPRGPKGRDGEATGISPPGSSLQPPLSVRCQPGAGGWPPSLLVAVKGGSDPGQHRHSPALL